jgi:hypothetical protein
MIFNATFNNISVISWRSVLLLEETGENTDLSQVTDKHLAMNSKAACSEFGQLVLKIGRNLGKVQSELAP